MTMYGIRLLGLLVGLLLLVGTALTSANVVGASSVGFASQAQNANTLKPPECAALVLDRIRIAGGRGTGGGSALVLGTPGNDSITGGGGRDCILGGGGNDRINGGGGIDVCIGGPGTDTFSNCETSYQ